MSVVDQQLVTVEEYARLPESGRPTELVRGRIVEMNVPTPRHGQICGEVVRLLANYVKEKGLGKVTSNDSGIITERDPDTMRGADVAFYSNKRFGEGPLPGGYFEEAPELVFEVLSSNDRWSKILSKVAEYLDAGVAIVCVLDPSDRTAYVYEGDRPVRILTRDQEIEFPELLGDFCVRVAEFFE
jgi:Uma2 family endonuclease